MVPRTLQQGYSDLVSLVKRINEVSIAEDQISEEISSWVAVSCNHTVTMAMSAIYALRAVLAERGPGARDEVRNPLLILQDIERRLVGFGEDPEKSEIRETTPHPILSESEPTAHTFVMGECEIIVTNSAETGIGVSVNHPIRYPTTKELMRARTLSPDRSKSLFAYFPGEGQTFGVSGYTIILVENPNKAGFV